VGLPAGSKPVTDNFHFAFEVREFDLQVLTTTAVNATRLLEVPFFYFFDPLGEDKCLFSIFYENGLYLRECLVFLCGVPFSGKNF
jgi:hypothetical protein